jgi:hypothetical protein
LPVDLKTLTPDTTVPSTAVLFGADSQAATDPSVYPLSAVRDGVNLGDVILTDAPFISWNVETSRIASVTLGGNRTLLSPTNHKDGGEYKLLVFQDATGGRTLAYDNNIVWPGGTAPNLSGAAANSLIVITFVSDGVRLYASADQTYTGDSPVLYHSFAGGNMPSWMTFSRSGHATMIDSTGNITWAPNNMLLNSATLSTQSVTTAAGHSNILSFRGTGSITLSGSATGTLAGTGVNNRVSLVIAPTTGSLTLTVTGQVLDAQLERVTYETSPRAYNPTTGVAFFGPRIDWTGGTPGLLIEDPRANMLFNSNDFTNATYWTPVNLGVGVAPVITPNAVISPDGRQNATTIALDKGGTAPADVSGVNATGVTVTAGVVYTMSVWLKATTPGDVGKVVLVLDPDSFNQSVTLTANWVRYTYTATRTSTGSYSARIRLVGNVASDLTVSVDVYGYQVEAGSRATSYIPTFTASVTRAVENATASTSNIPGFNLQQGTVIAQLRHNSTSVAQGRRAFSAFNAGVTQRLFDIYTTGAVWAMYCSWPTIYTTSMQAPTTVNRIGIAYQENNLRSAMNGTLATTAFTSTTAPPGTLMTFELGGFDGLNKLNDRVESFAIYNRRISDTALQAKTVAGANY